MINIRSPLTPEDAGPEDRDQCCHVCGDPGPYHYSHPWCDKCAAELEAAHAENMPFQE